MFSFLSLSFSLCCSIVLLYSSKERSHMEPLSLCSHSESEEFYLIMNVCGENPIMEILHQPCRKHRSSKERHLDPSLWVSAHIWEKNVHTEASSCHMWTRSWAGKIFKKPIKLHIQDDRWWDGVGMLLEEGAFAGRNICTHLWVDCCCSWRRSQRCCWMPWQRNQYGVETSPKSASADFREKRHEKKQRKKKGEQRGWKFLQFEAGLQPRI